MKKTKTQLEKENTKLQKQLEFYQKASISKPKEEYHRVPAEIEAIKQTMPEFRDIIEHLEHEVRCSEELLHCIMSKICNIDGGIAFSDKTEDKVFKDGVCGVLNKLVDKSSQNRYKLEIITDRLISLVG